MADYTEETKKLYANLASHGTRVFKLSIRGSSGGSHVMTHGNRTEVCSVPDQSYIFINAGKTTEDWRKDVRGFLESERNAMTDEIAPNNEADDDLPYRLYCHLLSLGYCDVDDIVSDVYEGAVAFVNARIVDSPAHEDQEGGFGHYGWESKDTKINS